MNRRCLSIAAVCTLATLAGVSNAPAESTVISAKQLGAPPEDVLSGRLRLPDPTSTALHGGVAVIPVAFKDGISWSHAIEIAHAAPWSIAIASGDGATFEVELRDPAGRAQRITESLRDPRFAVTRGAIEPFVDGAAAQRIDIDGGPGTWTLTLTPSDPTRPVPRAAVVIADRAPIVLTTQLETFDLHAGRPIPVRAELNGAVAERVELAQPGAPPIPMRRTDDGAWFGAIVAPAGETTVTVSAYRAGDATPLRTTAHRLTIVDRTLELTGVGIVESPRRHDPQWTIWLDTRWRSPGERVMLGAELWGRGADGAPTCVTWSGGYAEPDAHGALPLAIHDAWFDRVDVAPPYELRNVRVQHATSFVPIDTHDVIPLDGLDRTSDPTRTGALTAPSATMLAGHPEKRRVTVDASSAPVTLSDPDGPTALVLVHGYCSDGSPWRATDFSGPIAAFRDPEANRTHDEFALSLYHATTGLRSFGVVGHSQGGPAALHLSTFYFSGLDHAAGERLIQSVGAPYQGTKLAGNAAVLGEIFGFGCGTAFDMTYDGAALWLASIPSAARANVHYWTTSFSNRRFRNDYCSFFTDLLLSDPEDGVTESWAGHLPGAHDRGHVSGWCHTAGMQAPSQTHDPERNAEMNTRARR